MNYIDLINKFWQCNNEHPIGINATAMYFYLLKTCNSLGWKETFKHSDRYIAIQLGISVNTVRGAKNKLKQLGLIDFKAPNSPSRSLEGSTVYSLTVSYFDTVADTVADTRNKLNKTKLNLNNKPPGNIFYRIGNDTVQMKISDYFRQNNQITMEAILMQNKISEQLALKRLDDSFPPGYHFKDNNHLINSFRTAIRIKPDNVTPSATVATANIVKSNFSN